MATSLSLPLLELLPPLTTVSLLPLSLVLLAVAFLFPRPPSSSNEQRFSLLLPPDEKDRLAVPTAIGARPGSYASRHTTVRAPTAATGMASAGLKVIAPAAAAGFSFGAAAIIEIAAVARQESSASGLSRAAGVLSTIGVFFAGLTPILLLTRTSLTHIFPSCATLQPILRATSRTPTPTAEPNAQKRRASYRVGLLFAALAVASLYTLLTSALAPTVSVPTAAVAVGPGLEMLALLLPLPSILHLSPHRPILIPLLFGHFFGLVSRSLSLAGTFEAASTTLGASLNIAASGCTLLWVSILLLCTSVLAATPQRSFSPIPTLYPSPAQVALLQATLTQPSAAPIGIGIPPTSSPKTSSNGSVLDIAAAASIISSDDSEHKQSELPGYSQDPLAVEVHDPTALLRAALLRAMDSPSQQSAFDSIRSTLPADFTLGLQGSPALHGSATYTLPPVPVPVRLPGNIDVTPPRPRTAGTVQSLRRTISRLVRTPTRPRTAPSQPSAAQETADCSTLPSSRLTPPQNFGFAPSPGGAGEVDRSWLMDLEASPTGQIVSMSSKRKEKKSKVAEGVMVEVETESDSYDSTEETARK